MDASRDSRVWQGLQPVPSMPDQVSQSEPVQLLPLFLSTCLYSTFLSCILVISEQSCLSEISKVAKVAQSTPKEFKRSKQLNLLIYVSFTWTIVVVTASRSSEQPKIRPGRAGEVPKIRFEKHVSGRVMSHKGYPIVCSFTWCSFEGSFLNKNWISRFPPCW